MSKKYKVINIYSNYENQQGLCYLAKFLVEARVLEKNEKYYIGKILNLFSDDMSRSYPELEISGKMSEISIVSYPSVNLYIGDDNTKIYKIEKNTKRFMLQLCAVVNNINISKSFKSDNVKNQEVLDNIYSRGSQVSNILKRVLGPSEKYLYIANEAFHKGDLLFDYLQITTEGYHTLNGAISNLPDYFENRLIYIGRMIGLMSSYISYNEIPSLNRLMKKRLFRRFSNSLGLYGISRSSMNLNISGYLTKCPIISLLDI